MSALTYPAAISAKGDFDKYRAHEIAQRINAGHDIDRGTCCTFHSMKTLSARIGYALYIQRTMAGHVAKGHYTQEWAMSATLGDILAGNNGD